MSLLDTQEVMRMAQEAQSVGRTAEADHRLLQVFYAETALRRSEQQLEVIYKLCKVSF